MKGQKATKMSNDAKTEASYRDREAAARHNPVAGKGFHCRKKKKKNKEVVKKEVVKKEEPDAPVEVENWEDLVDDVLGITV